MVHEKEMENWAFVKEKYTCSYSLFFPEFLVKLHKKIFSRITTNAFTYQHLIAIETDLSLVLTSMRFVVYVSIGFNFKILVFIPPSFRAILKNET